MTVDQLGDYLKQHWPAIREQLLNGTYEPKPVRRAEIPKPDGGGMRKLGIPIVLDRFIQQAVRDAAATDLSRPYGLRRVNGTPSMPGRMRIALAGRHLILYRNFNDIVFEVLFSLAPPLRR